MLANGINNPAFIAKVENRTKERNYAVQSHESAHAAAAGSYGGGVNIIFGSDALGKPIAVGGFVPIKSPPIVNAFTPMNKIEQAQSQARTVAFAAIAPMGLGGEAGELSGADKAVYAHAMTAAAAADHARSQRIAFEGNIATKADKKPNANEPLSREKIAGVEKQNQNKPNKPLNIFA